MTKCGLFRRLLKVPIGCGELGQPDDLENALAAPELEAFPLFQKLNNDKKEYPLRLPDPSPIFNL